MEKRSIILIAGILGFILLSLFLYHNGLRQNCPFCINGLKNLAGSGWTKLYIASGYVVAFILCLLRIQIYSSHTVNETHGRAPPAMQAFQSKPFT